MDCQDTGVCLEIRPTKLIKGQGLAKILSESNYQALGTNFSIIASEESEEKEERQGVEVTTPETHIKYLTNQWYKEIIEYLLTLSCPPRCDKAKYRTLRLKSQKYIVTNGRLY